MKLETESRTGTATRGQARTKTKTRTGNRTGTRSRIGSRTEIKVTTALHWCKKTIGLNWGLNPSNLHRLICHHTYILLQFGEQFSRRKQLKENLIA